jgi:hypothetical protein
MGMCPSGSSSVPAVDARGDHGVGQKKREASLFASPNFTCHRHASAGLQESRRPSVPHAAARRSHPRHHDARGVRKRHNHHVRCHFAPNKTRSACDSSSGTPWVAPPTASCTSWRWRTKPTSLSASTICSAWGRGCPSSPTCHPTANTTCECVSGPDLFYSCFQPRCRNICFACATWMPSAACPLF